MMGPIVLMISASRLRNPRMSWLMVTINDTIACRYNSSIAAQPKTPVRLSEDVERNLEDGLYKHKKHDGRVTLNIINLPERFKCAANEVLAKESGSHCSRNAILKLAQYLQSRLPPIEDQDLRRKANELEKKLIAERSLPLKNGELRKEDNGALLKRLRHITYHWEPVDYDKAKAITYLCARAAPDIAVLTQIFAEIRKRSPDFAPKALMDFGSGIGTAIWAANGVWENTIQEYFAVDISADMNDLARLLMQDGKGNRAPFIRGTFFRQFLPSSHTLPYDMVVSAFALMELPNRSSRLLTLENLWKKTSDFLVVVETGTLSGYRLIMEARSHLLRQAVDLNTVEIFAPCNHKLTCPRLQYKDTPCNFQVSYEPLNGTKNSRHLGKFTDKYSYVVLRKKRPTRNVDEIETSSASWPRIVSEVLMRTRHVICRTCESDGRLHERVMTASKDGRDLYRCTRACRWGDRLPITNLPQEENKG